MASTYGWTHKEILYGLTARQFFMYLARIPIIESRQQMLRIESTTFPHMDKADRNAVLSEHQKTVQSKAAYVISDPVEVERNWKMLRKGIMTND